jgi:hypothetical protein
LAAARGDFFFTAALGRATDLAFAAAGLVFADFLAGARFAGAERPAAGRAAADFALFADFPDPARFVAGRLDAPARVVVRRAAAAERVGVVLVVLRRPFRLAMFSPFGTLTV